MEHFTLCFVQRGEFLYTVIVLEGGFLPPPSLAPEREGMVEDEIDSRINETITVFG